MKRLHLIGTVFLILVVAALLAGCGPPSKPDESCETARAKLREANATTPYEDAVPLYQTALREYVDLLEEDRVPECALNGIIMTLDGLTEKQQKEGPCKDASEAYKDESYLSALNKYAGLLESNPQLKCARSGIQDVVDKVPVVEGDCTDADDALNKELYDDAVAKYAALLKDESRPECAKVGVKKAITKSAVADKRCEHARELLDEGLYDRAVIEYGALVSTTLQLDCAQTGIKDAIAKRRGYEEKFAAVRALADLGLYTEAKTQLQEVLKDKENAGIRVPDDLKFLVGGKISWWRQLKRWIEPVGRPLGEIAAVIVIVYLARFVWNSRFKPWIQGSRRPRLDILKFDKGATGLEMGEGLVAMVEEVLKGLEKGDRPLTYLVQTPIEGLAIPADVKSVSPPLLKIVAGLIEWALPQNVVTLSGYLQKPGDHGAGLTLTLVEKRTGKIVASQTIWQKNYDPAITPPAKDKDPDPDSYYRLAEPAAIWTYFQLAEYLGKEDRPLGTKEWRSYAYFRAGVRWILEGEASKARPMFVEALNQDPNNRGAMFNLGAMDTEAAKYDQALKRLRWAKEAAEPEQKDKPHRDTVWYKAMYQLAATYFYKYKSILSQAEKEAKESSKQKKKAEAQEWLKLAEKEARELVHEIQETINALQESKDKMLKDFLESFQWLAKSMYAGILYGLNKKKAKELLNEIEKKPENLTYRDRYNLACCWSVIGDNENGEERTKAYKKALDHLKYGLERGGGIVRWAREDPSLEGVREAKETEDDFAKLIKWKRAAPATKPPDSVAFDLPAAKIRSSLGSLKSNHDVRVIMVVEQRDSEGKVVTHKAYRHDEAKLLNVLDADGTPIAQPYEKAATVRISLPLGTKDGPAVEFAAHLADASAIYVLPAP